MLCAHELIKADPSADIEILEMNSPENLGGLLRSETIEGFTYDIGGPHILFSRNQDVLDKILSILDRNVKQMLRKNYIHFEGSVIPYPFENGMFMLPSEDRAKIGLGIVESILELSKKDSWTPSSFYEWVYKIFGKEMGSRYLEPYNKKIWKRNLKMMDADWVFIPGRLPLPSLEDIVYSVSGIRTVGYKEQSTFYYPKEGGIKSLYDSLLRLVKGKGVSLITNVEVTSVQQSTVQGWIVNHQYEYDTVINTLPVGYFLNVLRTDAQISEKIPQLDYNKVVVIGVALDQLAPDQIAMYVPQEDIVFHRYSWMSNLVSDSPRGKSNLIAEITVARDTYVDPQKLIEETIEGLMKLQIISSRDVVIHAKAWVNEYGYPIYFKGHSHFREAIAQYFRKIGVFSVGRWGSWHYWNTDKVYEAVDKVVREIIAQ